MTLIITMEARNHIVVTADGRSKGKIESTTLQKIFPDPNNGFAIANHGQNLIDERNAHDIAENFFADNTAMIGKSSIKNVAQWFVKQFEQIILKTLGSIPGKTVCGFLFIGFSTVSNKPKIYEAFWEKNQNIIFRKHNDLVLSGEAKENIEQYLDDPKEKEFRKKNILKGTVQKAKVYCDRLYKLAEDAEAKLGKDRFGGHKHQLVIKKSNCEWLIPPKASPPPAAGQ